MLGAEWKKMPPADVLAAFCGKVVLLACVFGGCTGRIVFLQ
jgi:hypothetical protein